MHYVLINGRPTYEPDADKWAEWFETSEQERVVHQTEVDGLRVSTAFIGIDLRVLGSGPPLVYETMIFDAEGEVAMGGYQQRYGTLGEAKQGHWNVVEQIRAGRSA
ncbi:MAG: hypothetical protein AB7U20_14325 [Planctomycetaceae bacterium]